MVTLNHPKRTNNSHFYGVKSRLISGTFKDLSISPSELAELENFCLIKSYLGESKS